MANSTMISPNMIVSTDLVLNHTRPTFTEIGDIDFKNLDPISVKNCRLDDYLKHNSSPITDYLNQMSPLFDGDILVDVKFHSLTEGSITCIPGWHIDGSLLTSVNFKPEQYLLYVCGDSAMTEFCEDIITVPKSRDSIKAIHRYEASKISQLKSGWNAKYDATNMHRGTQSATTGERLLIRMMTSHVIKGSSYESSIFTPFNSQLRPMTDAEIEQAALDDPDAQPMTEEQLAKARRRVPRVNRK
jgi:hypothetical protein